MYYQPFQVASYIRRKHWDQVSRAPAEPASTRLVSRDTGGGQRGIAKIIAGKMIKGFASPKVNELVHDEELRSRGEPLHAGGSSAIVSS